MAIYKTSEDWLKETNFEIIDPDGWDRTNFEFSFAQEKISKEEFLTKLYNSTVRYYGND